MGAAVEMPFVFVVILCAFEAFVRFAHHSHMSLLVSLFFWERYEKVISIYIFCL